MTFSQVYQTCTTWVSKSTLLKHENYYSKAPADRNRGKSQILQKNTLALTMLVRGEVLHDLKCPLGKEHIELACDDGPRQAA